MIRPGGWLGGRKCGLLRAKNILRSIRFGWVRLAADFLATEHRQQKQPINLLPWKGVERRGKGRKGAERRGKTRQQNHGTTPLEKRDRHSQATKCPGLWAGGRAKKT